MARTLLGTRIRETRRSKKLSQKDLAQIAGISASYLNLIEHNRRGIAGKTLNSIAAALGLDPSTISEGMDRALVDRVKKAAMDAPHLNPEIAHVDEFAARYPGFARLIARLQDQREKQHQEFLTLADQMNHDPFFAEAIHLMLSNITTIRSTADILASDGNIPADMASKFMRNLLAESERMSQTASDVLEHFEPSSDAQIMSSDNSPFETLLEQNRFFLEDLENGTADAETILKQIKPEKGLVSQTRLSLQSYQEMAFSLPIKSFLETAEACKFDPLVIANTLSCDLPSVLFRMAHLPNDPQLPQFGFLQCDSSGAVLYRKQLPTFSLPRFGGACPIWPIYRSLSQSQQPIAALIDMPTGERFYTLCYSYPVEQAQIAMPARQESLMLFTPDYAQISTVSAKTLPLLSVGVQCSVCPRNTCSSRRTAYILGE